MDKEQDELFKNATRGTIPSADDTPVKSDIRERLNIISGTEDFSKYPAHRFLFGSNFIPEKRLSILYGPGGVGKSYFALQIAVALSSGEQLIKTFDPVEVLKVLYISLEDPYTVLGYRIEKISPAGERKNAGNLDLWAPESMPEDFIKELKELQTEENYGLVIIDPLISIISGMGVDENNNYAMQTVIDRLKTIAKDSETAVLLVHHTNKDARKQGEQAAGTALRGASAIADGCRFAIGLDKKYKMGGKGDNKVRVESPEIYLNNTKSTFARRLNEIALIQNDVGVLSLEIPKTKELGTNKEGPFLPAGKSSGSRTIAKRKK